MAGLSIDNGVVVGYGAEEGASWGVGCDAT